MGMSESEIARVHGC